MDASRHHRSNAPLNEFEIRLFGLRRSGNHAVLAWIASLFQREVCFLNDLSRKPDLSCQQPCDSLTGLSAHRMVTLGCPKQLLLYSFEDLPADQISRWSIPHNVAGESLHRFSVLLLRDPYNMLASRLKLAQEHPEHPVSREMLAPDEEGHSQIMKIWSQYALAWLDPNWPSSGELSIKIDFNRWAFSAEYRMALCHQLNGTYCEDTINRLPNQGFGSSFEGYRTGYLRHRIALLHRWRHFRHDPRFIELVSTPNVAELARTIFDANHLPSELDV